MTKDIDTPFGHAIPPFPEHSITLHIPKWVTVLEFVDNPQSVVARLKSIYPRLAPFGNVKQVGLANASHVLAECER